MTKEVKKWTLNKNNRLVILTIIIMFLILLCKELISSYISSIITLLPTFIIFLWFIINFCRKKITIKIYDILFCTMLIIGAISGLIYKQNIIAIIYQIKSLSIYYLMFMIIRSIKLTLKQKEKILKEFNICTIIIIIFSIIEIVFQKNILFPTEWAKEIVYIDNYIRAYSLICNPNVYGFYLLFILLFNYKYNGINLNIKSIIFYSLIIIGIVLSISRSALICLGIILIIYLIKLFLERKNRIIFLKNIKSVLIIILISTLATLAIYKCQELLPFENINNSVQEETPNHGDSSKKPITEHNQESETEENFTDRVMSMFDSDFLNNSLNNGRLAVVFYGLSIWKDHMFFGTGFSSFLTASSFLNPNLEAQKLGLEYSDNQYIALLVETGILGVSAIAFAFILFIKEQFKIKNYESIIATFIIAFFGLFINCLEVQLIAFLYFLFIGLNYNKNIKE